MVYSITEKDGKKIYEARKAIVLKDGKILLLKIDMNALQLGHNAVDGGWDLPGGRMHVGEEQDAVIKREVKEESGLDVSIERKLNEFEFHPRDDIIIHGINFLCTPSTTDVVLDDPEHQHEGFEWVLIDDALNYSMPGWIKDGIKLLK